MIHVGELYYSAYSRVLELTSNYRYETEDSIFGELDSIDVYLSEGGTFDASERIGVYAVLCETLRSKFCFEWCCIPSLTGGDVSLLRYKETGFYLWGYDRILVALESVYDCPVERMFLSIMSALYSEVTEPPLLCAVLDFFEFGVISGSLSESDVEILKSISDLNLDASFFFNVGYTGFDGLKLHRFLHGKSVDDLIG